MHVLRTESTRAGFSVVELLIVVAIAAVLVALIFPVAAKIRKSATTAPCMSHQKQIVAAMMAYAADNQGMLPDIALTTPTGETKPWIEVMRDYLTLPSGKYAGRQVLRCPAASKKRDDFTYGLNYSSGDRRVFTRRAGEGGNSVAYPGSQRLANLTPSAILIADAYDPLNPESSLFYHPASPNWPINTDRDGDGVVDSASSLGSDRKFNCIDPRHASDKAFIGVAADGSAKMLTIREWAETPKYWGP